jgi:hypothetical protein
MAQRKNPPRMSADGFRAKQFTLDNAPCSLDQSNEKRICFAQVEKIFFSSVEKRDDLSQINDIGLVIAGQRVARMRAR